MWGQPPRLSVERSETHVPCPAYSRAIKTRPEGTPENSPPVHWQVRNTKKKNRAIGTVESCVGESSYSATASFSITTFKCAVTSLCNFTGTVNSPRVFNGSCS
jgi:hypothetical protein